MAQAKQGDTVRVNYTGRLTDGTIFDSNQGRPPLSFTIGDGEVISGFEVAVAGMEVGESKTATIPADEAYGQHREDMVFTVPRNQLPDNLDPTVGQELQLRTTDDDIVPVLVTDVTDHAITIDANHPLAGETLVFDIELIEIA